MSSEKLTSDPTAELYRRNALCGFIMSNTVFLIGKTGQHLQEMSPTSSSNHHQCLRILLTKYWTTRCCCFQTCLINLQVIVLLNVNNVFRHVCMNSYSTLWYSTDMDRISVVSILLLGGDRDSGRILGFILGFHFHSKLTSSLVPYTKKNSYNAVF
jgi:hypothetical protein